MGDFNKFLLHTLSQFQGEELMHFRGYASQPAFMQQHCSAHGNTISGILGDEACLDDKTKLEILERRVRSLEHCSKDSQNMWKAPFRDNSKLISSRDQPRHGRAVFRERTGTLFP